MRRRLDFTFFKLIVEAANIRESQQLFTRRQSVKMPMALVFVNTAE